MGVRCAVWSVYLLPSNKSLIKRLIDKAYLANLANSLWRNWEPLVTEQEIYQEIRHALSSAERKQYMVEVHLQMLKYADELKHVTAKEFCEGVGLKESFGTEFSKMRNLTTRLKTAGLDPAKI